jgi:hypothetical protein
VISILASWTKIEFLGISSGSSLALIGNASGRTFRAWECGCRFRKLGYIFSVRKCGIA